MGGVHGYCFANGTADSHASGDAVCGTAVFSLMCSSAAQIQAVVEGSATTVAGNDDSFYSFVDGNRTAAHTVHAGYHVGAWRTSGSIFAQPMMLSAGAHTITLAEREDGTRVHSIMLTQGQASCRFVQPLTQAPTTSMLRTMAPVGGIPSHLPHDSGGTNHASVKTAVAGVVIVLLVGCVATFLYRTNRLPCTKRTAPTFQRLDNSTEGVELDTVTRTSGAIDEGDDDDDDTMLDIN
jgi:hypothetical protein